MQKLLMCVLHFMFQMDIDLETSDALYEKLQQLESEVRKKLKEKQKQLHSGPAGAGSS